MDLKTAILIQLASVLLGFLLGWLIPRPVEMQWWKNFRARRAKKKMDKIIPDKRENVYRWNAFEVEKITPIFTSMIREYSLTREQLDTDFSETPQKLPMDIRRLKDSYLPRFIDLCQASGQKYHNDGAYSLNQMIINRSADKTGRILSLLLKFGASDFETFAMSNMAMDQPLIEAGGRHISIREKYNLVPETFDPYRLEEIPLHLRFGTNTVVVTSDDLVVLPVRSQGQAIDTGGPPSEPRVHVLGEGMLHPADSEEVGGAIKPDPFLTVRRALRDEFDLDETKHYSPSDIKLLAIFFDFERYQPIALFTVKLLISAKELEEVWPLAKDAHEHADMAYLPHTPGEILKLFEGKQSFRGNPMSLASKHAKMSLFLSLFHYHPFASVKRAFELQEG